MQRAEGWINKSIVCLGFMYGQSTEFNPNGWTIEALNATMLQIKYDFPESA